MSMATKRKLLVFTVGYGEGHNSAARAIVQEAIKRGWSAQVVDPCSLSNPGLFALTQSFYRFCVRSAPWIWGITYAQTETANWSTKAHSPILSKVTCRIRELIEEFQPDVILCTYPLYAYMLDALRAEEGVTTPYGVVVTDSLEISRPWMLSKADVFYLPDEYSASLVQDRFALPADRICTCGFPVSSCFSDKESCMTVPSAENFRIIYGAHAPKRRVRADVRALLREFPGAYITVLAGAKHSLLSRLECDRVSVITSTTDMPSLFEGAHLYIGKAGAATVYEAYTMHLPLVINYALPGQEQGNLALIERDGVGRAVYTTPDLIHLCRMLLDNNAALWRQWKTMMREVSRSGGAACLMNDVEGRFLYEHK